jgi:hypothetical protein
MGLPLIDVRFTPKNRHQAPMSTRPIFEHRAKKKPQHSAEAEVGRFEERRARAVVSRFGRKGVGGRRVAIKLPDSRSRQKRSPDLWGVEAEVCVRNGRS